jgi:hypothetical protein
MSEDGVDIRPEDALQVAQRALAKANEHDKLEDEIGRLDGQIDELRERVVALELRQSEMDDDRPYEARSLDEKVGMVREYGYQKALKTHGKTTLDYSDIEWEVFDGKPGSKHCYKLIRRAAGIEDDDKKTGSNFPGFTARDPADGNYHLAVNAEAAKESVAFCSEKKTSSEGVR